jgi:hypothetical protein
MRIEKSRISLRGVASPAAGERLDIKVASTGGAHESGLRKRLTAGYRPEPRETLLSVLIALDLLLYLVIVPIVVNAVIG